MPLMIQEIFEYYFEQKQAEKKDLYVTREQLLKSLSFKLDTVKFTDFLGHHTAEKETNDPITPI